MQEGHPIAYISKVLGLRQQGVGAKAARVVYL